MRLSLFFHQFFVSCAVWRFRVPSRPGIGHTHTRPINKRQPLNCQIGLIALFGEHFACAQPAIGHIWTNPLINQLNCCRKYKKAFTRNSDGFDVCVCMRSLASRMYLPVGHEIECAELTHAITDVNDYNCLLSGSNLIPLKSETNTLSFVSAHCVSL